MQTVAFTPSNPLVQGQPLTGKNKKEIATPQYSHVVPHRSTDWAVRCLTLQIGRDAVLSSSYGSN